MFAYVACVCLLGMSVCEEGGGGSAGTVRPCLTAPTPDGTSCLSPYSFQLHNSQPGSTQDNGASKHL